jgi:hypothetical protein
MHHDKTYEIIGIAPYVDKIFGLRRTRGRAGGIGVPRWFEVAVPTRLFFVFAPSLCRYLGGQTVPRAGQQT